MNEIVRCPHGSSVVATDAHQGRRLIPSLPKTTWNGSTTAYFAAERSPIEEAILVLNGNGSGLINSVCVPSDVTPSYAPRGEALISVSIVGVPDLSDDAMLHRVQAELEEWFGSITQQWRLLRVYRIRKALLRIEPGVRPQGDDLDTGGVFVCGDYLATPSINGAMTSGRQAAGRVLAALGSQR